MIKGFKAVQLKEQLKDSVSKLRSTFDAMKDAVSLIDVEGKIVLSNRAMSELLGKPFHDIIGRTCWELVHGTSEPIPKCPIVRMKETLKRETLALKIKDRWFEVTTDPILDESGGLNGAIHTISDIADRKRVEDALKESEHRISDALEFNNSILRTSSIGILTYDAAGQCVFANEAAAEIAGTNVAGLLLQNFHQVRSWEKTGMYKAALRALNTNIEQYTEVHVVTTFGKDVWLSLKFSSFLSRGEKHLLVFTYDITERKQAEETLRESEKRLRVFLQNSAVVGWMKDEDGRYVFMSENFQKRFGVHFEDCQGKKDFDLWPRNFAETFRRNDLIVLDSGRTLEGIEGVPNPDGSLSWWWDNKFLFQDETGKRFVGGLGVDITDRKRLEDNLKNEHQELKLIIDSSPIIVFYKDKEGKFIRVNKTFAEALKLPEEEFVGKTVFDLYSAKIAQDMTNDDQEVLKSGNPKINIIEQYESASGIKWVQTDKIPICDKNGIPFSLIGFSQDITERKRMEEELKRSNEMKVFGQLAAGVAHEVRNPLNAILSITEALFHDIGENPEYLPYLEHIRNQVDRLSILMKDLLEIGKPIFQDSFQPETVAGIVTSTIGFWGMLDLSKKYSLRYISHPESEKLRTNTEIKRES